MVEIDPFEQLRRLEAIDEAHATEAARLLAQTRTTPFEGRAVELLLSLHARAPIPDSLLLSVASILIDRGEETVAEAALRRTSSSPALMLRADLLAQSGNMKSAAALVERVLLRDIDFPGARERHARWCTAIGRESRAQAPEGVGRGACGAFITDRPGIPFHLIREVARGGSATVYEAEDRDLGRRVALKVYHRPDRDRAQLAHEARVAVALEGPGVVRIWDVNVAGSWLAMQWAPEGALGPYLKAMAAGRREGRAPRELPEPLVDEANVARWARALARVLGRVHDAGWAHLDVKPANVLLHAQDAVTLTDFGIARRFGEPSPPGTFGYVSPERLAGRPSDPRDDVYGFGRVLEDVLDDVGAGPAWAGWRALASACTGPEGARPENGSAIAAMAEGGSRRDRNRG